MTHASLTPASPTFAATFVGVAATSVVMLRSRSNYPWLYSITVPAPFGTSAALTGTLSAHGSLQIPLTCTPTAVGTASGTLRVTFTAPDGAESLIHPTLPREGASSLTAALSCTARENVPGWQDAGLTAIDYSHVVCGSPLDHLPMLYNPANRGVCTLTSVTVTGTGFSLVGAAPASIAEGASASVTVRFLPPTGQGRAEQGYTGTLTVAWTRGSETGTLTLPLAGVGLEPQEVEDDPTGTADDGSVGGAAGTTRRRATVHVPTHDSYLSLGRAYLRDGSCFTQDGFSASTTRHVLFRAALSVTFQAEGQVWFQSGNGAFHALAVGGATLVATNGLYVGGDDSVGVMAGYGAVGDPADVRNTGDDDPPMPAAIESLPTSFLAADLIWEIADKLFCVFTIAKTIERTVHLNRTAKEPLKELSSIGAMIQTGAGIAGLTTYVIGRATGAPTKNLNFYSQAGILAGTPAFCSMYGLVGMNYRSANVTLLGNVAVAVSSLLASTLDSLYGNTAVSSGTDLTVQCFLGTYLYCTEAPLKVYGSSIALGGLTPDGFQMPTLTMKVSALQKVLLATTVGGKVELKSSKVGKIGLSALGKVQIDSLKATTIELAKWKIVGDATGLRIEGARGTVIQLSAAGIDIGTPGGQLKVMPAMADVAGGVLKVMPGTVMITGMADLG